MKCPFCAHVDDKVIDSREGRGGDTIRRRRECLKCSRRFTTYERIDEIPYMVIKKDGRRERFERQKILQGLLKACEKRPVPTPKLEGIVDEIEGVVACNRFNCDSFATSAQPSSPSESFSSVTTSRSVSPASRPNVRPVTNG